MNTLITYCFGFQFACGFNFKREIIAQANWLAGGCTVTYSDGYWVPGADKTQTTYNSPAEEEVCMKIEMLVPTSQVEFVLKWMRNATISAYLADHAEVHNRQPKIDMEWVQVTTVPVTTHHFSPAEDAKR